MQQWAMNIHVNGLTAGRLKLPQIRHTRKTHFVLVTGCHTDYRLMLLRVLIGVYLHSRKELTLNDKGRHTTGVPKLREPGIPGDYIFYCNHQSRYRPGVAQSVPGS